jgi:hypothetical protein
MSASVTVTFHDLSPSEAKNLFASLRCDYDGPAPVVEPSAPLRVTEVRDNGTVVAEPAELLTVSERIATPVNPVEAPKKRGRPRKTAAADATPPSGDLPSAAGEPPKQPTLNEARTALAELSSKKGLDACRKLLEKFGAHRIGELDVGKYADFIQACAA